MTSARRSGPMEEVVFGGAVLGVSGTFLELQHHAGAVGHHPQRGGKIHIFIKHDELEKVATRAAPKAMESLARALLAACDGLA